MLPLVEALKQVDLPWPEKSQFLGPNPPKTLHNLCIHIQFLPAAPIPNSNEVSIQSTPYRFFSQVFLFYNPLSLANLPKK